MGLDQYAYSTSQIPDTPVDFETPEDRLLIHQWRKHPDLQGWMEALYFARGGKGQNSGFVDGITFNSGNRVALTLEDIDHLEFAIQNGNLPKTEGFFFGKSSGEERMDDLLFTVQARLEINAGRCIYYTSWW
jgi:hypothetical protein